MRDPAAEAVYAKVTWRIMPMLIALFILAWLDRVNIGFAKLQMQQDLGFSEAVYGLGAGIFFIGYFLFEVPSNLLLERIGARRTLARIAMLWGVTTSLSMFIAGPAAFYALRFLLGVFEAGLFPGVILYLTYWYPARRRAAMIAAFVLSNAIAGIIGGPIAGVIMSTMGGVANLANWQWLVLLEGVPSIVVGLVVLAALPDRPADARFLSGAERTYLAEALRAEASTGHERSFALALRHPSTWLFVATYFCIVAGNATVAFWTPSIIRALGIAGPLNIGLISALPYLLGAVAMVLNARHSDRTRERSLHCCLATLVASASFAVLAASTSPTLGIAALVVAAAGILSAFPPFWEMPLAVLGGTAAAGGVALINSVGNLAGFVAPFLMGWLATLTGRLSGGLYCIAAFELAASVLVLAIGYRKIGQAARA